MKNLLLLACCMTATLPRGTAQVYYAGTLPGKAVARHSDQSWRIENSCLLVEWTQKDQKISFARFIDKQLRHSILFREDHLFRVVLENGISIGSAAFELSGKPAISLAKAIPGALKSASRLNAQKISAQLINREYGIKLHWEAILRDSTNYVRQFFSFSAANSLPVAKVIFISLPDSSDVSIAGKVDGTPLVTGNFFFAVEHPLSQTAKETSYISCFLSRQTPVTATDSFCASTVWGVTPKAQLRRGFLYYVEKERAVAYRQFLHYNSWFDISWADRKLSEDSCMDRIQVFADSLITKRKTRVNAFLFDDGWDDNQTLWQFNKGFPNGFSRMRSLAAKYHSSLGVWISPWGGYDEAKQQRLRYGKMQNPPFETNGDGFSLAGANYYTRFKTVATRFVTEDGIAIFKYDGIGSIDGANGTTDGSSGKKISFRKDFEAMLGLVADLRKIKPDLYFSLTIGTWPSPSWLQYADNIWRSGWDNGQTGSGSKRQQWLNFRDGEVYRNIVQRAPLYPLNAVMNHGICIAGNGLPAQYEMDDKNLSDEIWSFFATGASLQEMYINPHKLSAASWDCLARAIHWSRENVTVMPDVHWIGGNPNEDEVYGYAAWTPGKAVLSLRNPSGQEKTYTITTDSVFDLPPVFKGKAYSFYAVNKGNSPKLFCRGKSCSITLAPFETIVFDAIP